MPPTYADWLAERLDGLRAKARTAGEGMPARLPADEPLFNVPAGLVRIFDADCAAAGIVKRDEHGRSIDVHSLRTTFATHLSKGGIAPRTAQAALRHSKIELTMQAYTDPRLLDVAGALDVLPTLPLDDSPKRERAKATGTGAGLHVPTLVPTVGKRGISASIADKTDRDAASPENAVSDDTGKTCQALTSTAEKRVIGFEPTTFTLAT